MPEWFYAVGNDHKKMCPEEFRRWEEALDQKFLWPRRMLDFTGLIFYREQRTILRAIRIAIAIILTGLVIYQFGFLLKVVLGKGSLDFTSVRELLTLIWFFQSLLSMGFLFYWQFYGHLQRLREDIHCPKGCPMTGNVIKRAVLWYMSMLALIVGLHIGVLWRKIIGDSGAGNMFDDEIFEMYGTRKLIWLSVFVWVWSMYVWVAVITFFVCIITALQHELHAFNKFKLKMIGDQSDGDMAKIAQEIEALYVTHVELANRVRNIDKTFEVFTFAMVSSNVPTSIFCLLFFMLSLQSGSWIGLLVSIPDLAFCLLELFALTSAPAKVHARIREVEDFIYGNIRIWQPFDNQVYRLASVFIAHANQSNLGITLWGFAVVTKPLILTMISLTVTYLALIIQFHDDRNKAVANVVHQQMPTNYTSFS